MSSCLILQDKNRLFMGSDSALISFNNDKLFRISNNGKKIFNIKNSLVFCSGSNDIVYKTINFIENLSEINIKKISDYLKDLNLVRISNFFNIEIIICLKIDNIIKIYQLSEYNNFDIIEYVPLNDNIRIITGGIKTEKCADLATKYFNWGETVIDIFKNTYNDLSCEEIGGNLEIWEISDTIKKIYEFNIKDTSQIFNKLEFANVRSVVGDVIVGRLLAGNELYITNESNTFTLNGQGAQLIDASFTLSRSDGNSKILIDPNVGIQISKRVFSSGSYTSVFSIDSQGNLIFSGNLQGASGTFNGTITANDGYIGGWKINQDGLSSSSGDYINSNGNIRLGMLTIQSSDAWFHGNIYANNLQGLITYNQIGSVNADTIITGTLAAIDIYGCNIYWPGVHMYQDAIGRSLIEADKNIILETGINTPIGAGITIASADNGGSINIWGNNYIYIGERFGGIGTPTIMLKGIIMTEDGYSNKGTGISGTYVL